MKLAHFSDIHVSHFPLRGAPAWKRLAAVASYSLLGRGRHFHHSSARIAALFQDLEGQQLHHSICTGDVTGVSSRAEFSEAAGLFGVRLQQPHLYTCIPGNHDRYVQSAQGLFEHHFASLCEGGRFPFVKHLGPKVLLVGIDVTRPTNPIDSSGLCGTAQRDALRSIVCDASLRDHFVILAMHYGLLRGDGQRDKRRHGLRDDLELMSLIDEKTAHLDLVIHGHMHRPYVVKSKRRALICAGSATDLHVPGAGYNVYDIDALNHEVTISRRRWNGERQHYEADPSSPLNCQLKTK
jgi:predicted phosphodiesterase